MDETAKYLIHASVTADGVVERSDVVGAIFGQTEGLLGEELDLRDLQQSSKVGRIDVEIGSEGGRSTGEVTIASRLDRIETAILAAALETIDRVGPCEAAIEVSAIEDVRQAKRRQVVERAKELLETAFDEEAASSAELVEEVRESVRVERITDYEGLPAGPRVETSDAIIVVEGRADVLTLLKYGIKNAVAVEGTNVPEAIADLTRDRTATTFLDGDRGGDLILRELDQVGEIDYVAYAPEGRSVEDLDRHEVLAALREKVPAEMALAELERESERQGEAGDEGEGGGGEEVRDPSEAGTDAGADEEGTAGGADAAVDAPEVPAGDDSERAGAAGDEPDGGAVAATRPPETLPEHVEEVIRGGSGEVRLLDGEFRTVGEAPATEAVGAIADADAAPATVVIDGEATQRLLDVAAQRGVERVVAREAGEFTKQPASVRLVLADEVTADGA